MNTLKDKKFMAFIIIFMLIVWTPMMVVFSAFAFVFGRWSAGFLGWL